MDQRQQLQHQRSPSFIEVNFAKPAAIKTKNSPKSQQKFKAIPSIQLLQSLNIYSPSEQPSTTKKSNYKAVRTAELNLDEFKKPVAVKANTKNIRKQLWSASKTENTEKGDSARRCTVSKLGNYRKTVYSKPSSTITKKGTAKKCSNDDTLALEEMDQFTVTKIKRTLFPSEQISQRKNVSHISVLNKKPLISTITKKITKPKIVVTPAEKSTRKSSNEKPTISTNNSVINSNNKKIKIVIKDHKDELIELLIKRITGLEEKLKAMDDIRKLLKTICGRLDIEMPESLLTKSTKKQTKHKKSPTGINSAKKNNNNNNSANLDNVTLKLSPLVSISTITEKPHPSFITIQTENPPENTSENQAQNSTDPAENPKIINVEKLPETPKKHTPIKNNHIPESTMKLKKTWITQFEQIENKLLNNPNISLNLNSSPDDSPVTILQLDEIVNHKNDTTNLQQIKSQSTSNLTDAAQHQQKKILFKNKETDLLTESICVYNELRDEMKFLSTPVNNKTMNFITPSVQGNEKKMISRRVQEQLLRLNDY